jgi:hypothetical protein
VLVRFFGLLDRGVQRLEQARGFAALFFALSGLLLLQMWPVGWTANEEHYLQLAYRTFAPGRFSPYHAVSLDHSLMRVGPLYLLGSTVGLLGYDGGQAVLRIGSALLYAAGLAYFFSALTFSVWDALLVLVVFLMSGEQLIGGEWLFQGVETKTLAYGLLFFAFGFALRRRWRAATGFAAAASYMHFLIGGFWALLLWAEQRLESRDCRSVLRTAGLFVLLTLPLVVLILRDRIVGAAPPGTNTDSLYAARVPWHVAPFATRREFWEWTWGVSAAVALVVVLATLWARRPPAGRPALMVLRIAVMSLGYLLIALAAAFLDRRTQLLAKFYLFRPSALALFFSLTAIAGFMVELLSRQAGAVKALLVFALVATFSWRTFKMQVDRVRFAVDSIPERAELIEAVAAKTAPGDVVLIEPFRQMQPDHLRLHREMPRPTLVARKFLPTNPADLLRWDAYLRMETALFENGCQGPAPPVRWLVALRPATAARLERSCGTAIWRKGNVALIPAGGVEQKPQY